MSSTIYLFLDYPDLEQIDPAILKYCHAAATTCIIEAGKQKADKSIIRYPKTLQLLKNIVLLILDLLMNTSYFSF